MHGPARPIETPGNYPKKNSVLLLQRCRCFRQSHEIDKFRPISELVLTLCAERELGHVFVTIAAGKAAAGSSVPTSMARAAGIAMTKAMSKEYAPDNVLVNTVCIGSIKSGQNDRKWESAVIEGSKLTLDEYYDNNGKNIPLGRVGEAMEAGDMICFLLISFISLILGLLGECLKTRFW